MPLYANGTLIPENVANALTVNGVNITQVIANGVAVWTQNLYNPYWTGSLVYGSYDKTHEIEMSGQAYRANAGTYSVAGPWIYAGSFGLANGSSIGTGGGNSFGVQTTNNTWFFYLSSVATSGTISFSTTTGFSGSSLTTGLSKNYGHNTSGGAIRAYHPDYSSPWVYLQ